MKAFAVCISALAVMAAAPAFAGDLTIELTGAKARPGKIIAVLSTKDTFQKSGGMEQTVDPTDGTVRLVFRDLPPGEYAFMAFHDESQDGDLQFDAGGMPAEGWALSNADKLRGPPSFEAMKFSVPAEGATVAVPLVYPR